MGELQTQADIKLSTQPLVRGQYIEGTIKSGENITVDDNKLVILGFVDNKYVEIKTLTGTDGSSRPVGILAHTVDASAGDKSGEVIYIAGDIQEDAIVLDGSLTLDSVLTGAPSGTTIRQELKSNGFNIYKTQRTEREY